VEGTGDFAVSSFVSVEVVPEPVALAEVGSRSISVAGRAILARQWWVLTGFFS
jgi:hypothetical protein